MYRSTDAGKTFNKLRGGNLPSGEMGRTGHSFSLAQKGLVYAHVEGAERGGGVYRSTDSGASWERRNENQGAPMYYQNVHADPNRP